MPVVGTHGLVKNGLLIDNNSSTFHWKYSHKNFFQLVLIGPVYVLRSGSELKCKLDDLVPVIGTALKQVLWKKFIWLAQVV